MPAIRTEYKRLIENMVLEVERRRASGEAAELIARWAVEERRRIVSTMRARSGRVDLVVYELRDRQKYGPGGRTYENLARRHSGKAATRAELSELLIKGARTSNDGVSEAAIKGARYLKQGGRVIMFFSLSLTAYTLLTASEGELMKTVFREGGGSVGGFVGSGLAVGACVVFGIATGGWGLLACGAVGGLAGGAAGTWAGDRLYYSRNSHIEVSLEHLGYIQGYELVSVIPPNMCRAQ
ncbi:MAG: hypothetical protein JWN48_4482 [Myxococcaceae bacterium]|nr:hypothetical protein [Myxococcaceae bacterium]